MVPPANCREMNPQLHWVGASVEPGLAAIVGDRDAVDLALVVHPTGWCADYVVASHPLSDHRDVYIGELAEPELRLLGHLVLKDHAAAIRWGGDSDAQGCAGAGSQIGGQAESLIRIQLAVVPTARISEMDPQLNGVG